MKVRSSRALAACAVVPGTPRRRLVALGVSSCDVKGTQAPLFEDVRLLARIVLRLQHGFMRAGGGGARAITAGALTALFVLCGSSSPAAAHGDDETNKGYLLVQQALGHLAHDTSAEGIDLAMEKVGDAMETDDQDGVDVSELEQGMAALQAGDPSGARTLLQDSIQDALAGLPRATGTQTGTTVVLPELEGRSASGGDDVLLLLASIAVAGAGAWLAFVYRPHDSIGVLRALLGSSTAGPTSPPSDPHEPVG